MYGNKVLISSIQPFRKSLKTAAAIMPGSLCMRSSGLWAVHGTAGAKPPVMYVAEEDMMQGKDSTETYLISTQMPCRAVQGGDEMNMRLAIGQVTTLEMELTSDGLGGLRAVATGEVAVALALEVKDNSVSGAVAALIHVLILD